MDSSVVSGPIDHRFHPRRKGWWGEVRERRGEARVVAESVDPMPVTGHMLGDFRVA